MWNPFTTPLSHGATVAGQVAAQAPAIGDGGHYNFPAPEFEYGPWEPIFSGEAPDGFYTPGGATPDPITNAAADTPDYAGRSGVTFFNNPGIPTQADYSSVNPAPGSADLSTPRDVGSVSGVNTMVRLAGPVGGDDNYYSGYIAKLRSPQAGVRGPVSGGDDYSGQLATAHYAAQAQYLSQEAAANALVSAV